MKIAIGGTHHLACKALSYLIELGIDKMDIFVCKSNRDNELNTWQRSLLYYANKLEIQVVSLDQLYNVKDLIFFSLEFDKIIRTKRFNSAKFFNIHFSLLPKYKGMYTSCLPLLNGDTISGVTLHRIDDGIDTGDIVDQISFPIPLSMNSFGLFSEYHNQGFNLFKNNIERILKGNEISFAQSALNSSYFPKNSIDFSNIEIDFKKTAFQVHNFIRAFSFRPYQLATISGFSISHSKISLNRSEKKPGELLELSHNKSVYSTIDFDLEVYKDQLDLILSASAKNNLSFIIRCVEEGYDVSEKNNKGWDPLIVAAHNNSYEVLDYLLDNGQDPNSVNVNGTSALMYSMTNACQSNDLKSMIRLIDAGAKIDYEDYRGVSLLEYASRLNNSKVIELLNTSQVVM